MRILPIILSLTFVLSTGCRADDVKPACGDGTIEQNGECVGDGELDADADADDTGEPIDPVVDNDEDGIAEADDCDDDDASLGAMADDADCDTVLTADDCNDDDANSTLFAISLSQAGKRRSLNRPTPMLPALTADMALFYSRDRSARREPGRSSFSAGTILQKRLQ